MFLADLDTGDLLGIVSGDTIVAIDGQALESLDDTMGKATAAAQRGSFTLTLRNADLLRIVRYEIIDG